MSDDVSMFPSLALNTSQVPGGLGAEPLGEDFYAGSLLWTDDDARPSGSPIGYVVALDALTAAERVRGY